jgi:hypothetical protein
MYLTLYLSIYVCMHVCMYVCTKASMYILALIWIWMWIWIWICIYFYIYIYISLYIYIRINLIFIYLDLHLLHVFWSFWDLPISKISRTIGNWHAQNFEKCSLSSIGRLLFWIYAWLGLFALDCAYVRPKLRLCFLLQIALRYWKCSLFLILITILDICSKAPKVQGSKKIM